MKRLALFFLALACVAVSCTPEDVMLRDSLISGNGIWAQKADTPLFSYDENNCQYSYSRDEVVFHLFDDTMSNWLKLDCKGAKLSLGASIQANLEWTTSANVLRLNSVPFELLKIENGLYYFWCSRDNIPLRLRTDF